MFIGFTCDTFMWTSPPCGAVHHLLPFCMYGNSSLLGDAGKVGHMDSYFAKHFQSFKLSLSFAFSNF